MTPNVLKPEGNIIIYHGRRIKAYLRVYAKVTIRNCRRNGIAVRHTHIRCNGRLLAVRASALRNGRKGDLEIIDDSLGFGSRSDRLELQH